jgi:hypothetical protein
MLLKRAITLRPDAPVTRSVKPTIRLTQPTNPDFITENALLENVESFVRRIKKKGSKEFDKVFEAMVEIPSEHANGVLLTHHQVCRAFDVTSMTLYKWRQHNGLPVTHLAGGKKPPVRYDEGLVLAWGQLLGKKVINHDYKEWV